MNNEFENIQAESPKKENIWTKLKNKLTNKKGLPFIILGAALVILIIVAALVIPSLFKDKEEDVNLFNENLVCFQKGDEWGYANKKGKVVIKAKFEEAYAFAENGLALVKDDGEYGFINKRGEIVIKTKYVDATGFYENGLAVVMNKDGEVGAINKKGKTVVDFKYSYIGEFNEHGTAVVAKTDDDGTTRYGVVNSKGDLVFPVKYEAIMNPNKSGATVAKVGEEWGVLKKNGEWAIKPKFDSATAFDDNNLSIVQIGEEYGIVNNKGKVILAPKYAQITAFSEDEGLAFFLDEDEWGIINTKGKVVCEAEFDKVIAPFKDGRAIVEDGSDYMLINSKGVEIFEFDDCIPMGQYSDNGLVLVKEVKKSGEGKFGFLDKKGNIVVDFDYKAAQSFSKSGLAAIYDGKEYGFINKKGKEVIAPEYDAVRGFFDDGFALAAEHDNESGDVKIYIINKNGKHIFECDNAQWLPRHKAIGR